MKLKIFLQKKQQNEHNPAWATPTNKTEAQHEFSLQVDDIE